MDVVLISTYELGHQPFGLASPAAWLKAVGARVACLDLAVQAFEPEAIARAGLVAIYVPMHTATRMAEQILTRIRTLNPDLVNPSFVAGAVRIYVLPGQAIPQAIQLSAITADAGDSALTDDADGVSLYDEDDGVPVFGEGA